MFDFNDGPLANGTRLLSLVASLLYLRNVHAPPSIGRMVTKTTSTALLSALSFLTGDSKLLSVALLLSSLGDAFLAWDGEPAFLAGLGSFLAGHITYIRLFSQLGGGSSFVMNTSWRLVIAAIVVCAFAPKMAAELMPKVERGLRLPILGYTTAIVAMVVTALTVDKWMVVSGALMFTASDGILATERFLVGAESRHRAWMPYAVWLLYYAGQLQITLGVLS